MFYNPFLLEIEKIPTIVYPSGELETVIDRTKKGAIEDHLNELYEANYFLRNPIIGKPDYNIDVVWKHEGEIMTDVWIYAQLGKWPTGPLNDVNNFRGLNPEVQIGVSCGNGLIMLGRESSHLSTCGDQLPFYFKGRPILPGYIRVGEDFEQS